MAQFIPIRNGSTTIDVSALKQNDRKLRAGLIAPAKEEFHTEVVEEHDAEPIKKYEDIERITSYLIQNKRWRDNAIFILGINFGLRAGDLLSLRFGDLITNNMMFKEHFYIFEQKTRNTRKKKKNRCITINRAVIEAVTLYLENTPGVTLSDYMFKNQSNSGIGKNEPMTLRSLNRILGEIANTLELGIRVSTHTLRKTFGYHQIMMSSDPHRKLMLLQKMFGHSSPAQTLDYIGLTGDEIAEAYRGLNLGSKHYNYIAATDISESDDMVG